MHVIIIGAGIVGMTSALALGRAGARVTLVEQDAIPGTRGASNDDHRLLRHGYPGRDGYALMAAHAQAAWRRLFDVTGEQGFEKTGVLALSAAPGDFAANCLGQYQRLGLAYELLSAQALAERYSVLETGNVREASLQADGGVLMAARILRSIGRALAAHDVELIPGMRVEAVSLTDARVALEDGRSLKADRVLVTAGAWSAQLVPPSDVDAGDRSTSVRQASAYVRLAENEQTLWEAMPAVLDFGSDDGVYAIPPVRNTRMKFGRESHARTGNADDGRFPFAREGVELMRPIWPLLASPEAYTLHETRVCYTSVGFDDRYVVNQGRRGVSLSGCSGHMFKMGSVIGEGLNAWVQGLVSDSQLHGWLRGDTAFAKLPEHFHSR